MEKSYAVECDFQNKCCCFSLSMRVNFLLFCVFCLEGFGRGYMRSTWQLGKVVYSIKSLLIDFYLATWSSKYRQYWKASRQYWGLSVIFDWFLFGNSCFISKAHACWLIFIRQRGLQNIDFAARQCWELQWFLFGNSCLISKTKLVYWFFYGNVVLKLTAVLKGFAAWECRGVSVISATLVGFPRHLFIDFFGNVVLKISAFEKLCWPAMLGSVGDFWLIFVWQLLFDSQDTTVLRQYWKALLPCNVEERCCLGLVMIDFYPATLFWFPRHNIKWFCWKRCLLFIWRRRRNNGILLLISNVPTVLRK